MSRSRIHFRRGAGPLACLLAVLAVACADPGRAPGGEDAPGQAPGSAPEPSQPGSEESLRVDLIDVSRPSSDVVEVRLALVNGGSAPLEIGTRFAQREQDGASVSGLVLIEEAVQKRTFVLRDANDGPLCSRGVAALAPGERRVVWARFPAPVSDAVTVALPGLESLGPVDVPPAPTP